MLGMLKALWIRFFGPDINKVLNSFNKILIDLEKVIEHHNESVAQSQAAIAAHNQNIVASTAQVTKANTVKTNISALLGD
jgi:hypothetical protein